MMEMGGNLLVGIKEFMKNGVRVFLMGGRISKAQREEEILLGFYGFEDEMNEKSSTIPIWVEKVISALGGACGVGWPNSLM